MAPFQAVGLAELAAPAGWALVCPIRVHSGTQAAAILGQLLPR